MRQYKLHEETKEIQQFSNMNKHKLPNSKRTLIPSYQPINNQENINHKAFSYYSNKFNTNSVGPDFIPNEESKVKIQRKSAAQILEESSQPLNIRQLKPNILHKKYVESSQINNIPGPEIMKRYETNDNNNGNTNVGKYSANYLNRLYNTKKDMGRKKSYECRKTDIESFQRKVFRDYNSNIACLPGVTINEKEKLRSLVAPNSRRNESHISLGYNYENKKIIIVGINMIIIRLMMILKVIIIIKKIIFQDLRVVREKEYVEIKIGNPTMEEMVLLIKINIIK